MPSEFDITGARLEPGEAHVSRDARRSAAAADDFFADEEISWDEETDAIGRRSGQLWVGTRRPSRDAGVRLRDEIVRRPLAVGIGGLALLGLVLGLVLGLSGGGKPLAPVIPVTPTPTPTPTAAGTTAKAPTSGLAIAIPTAAKALKLGDRGTAVRALQRALSQLGFAVGTPDGIFGQKTREAVVSFQQAHGLSPDGVVGPQTARAVNRALVAG
jgi:hypothetical protein